MNLLPGQPSLHSLSISFFGYFAPCIVLKLALICSLWKIIYMASQQSLRVASIVALTVGLVSLGSTGYLLIPGDSKTFSETVKVTFVQSLLFLGEHDTGFPATTKRSENTSQWNRCMNQISSLVVPGKWIKLGKDTKCWIEQWAVSNGSDCNINTKGRYGPGNI